MTKRDAIESLRIGLQERNADSNFPNRFLYNKLLEHSSWLIKREIYAGRIYKNTAFFQTLSCIDVIETSLIDPCCPVKTNCKIYRTKHKLPEMWLDNDGPVIKSVTSVDSSTSFQIISPTAWQDKRDDPYQKFSKQMYTFYADGYLWFPEHNPHKVNVVSFYKDDISALSGCAPITPCIRFLDTLFALPAWLEAECISKAVEQIAGITKRMPEDTEINKNPTRR